MLTVINRIASPELREKAWKILVKELGIIDATRFVMSVEPGSGDSVEEYGKMWQGKSIDQIHKEIIEAQNKEKI
jgi:hypothetical protein